MHIFILRYILTCSGLCSVYRGIADHFEKNRSRSASALTEHFVAEDNMLIS